MPQLNIYVNEKEYKINFICKMSDEPIKFGFGIKISEEIWRELKENKEFKAGEIKCKITDEIDVGNMTWFVFEPENEEKFIGNFKGSISNIEKRY